MALPGLSQSTSVSQFGELDPISDPVRRLTPRQRQVVELIARGLDIRQIADTLVINYDAARMHVNRIADLLDNPRLLTPLRLVRQWAVAQEFLRQGRPLDK